MSKTIGNDLKTHLAGECTTIATCWRIERTDSQEFFFTDHDTDIVYDGDTYESASGMLPSQLSQNLGMAVDNLDLLAFLQASKVTEADILAGLYDYAAFDIFLINYEDTSMGIMYYLKDWKLGEVTIQDNAFRVEARGKAQLLQQQIIDVYSPSCRNTYGDNHCTLTRGHTTGTVTGVTDKRTFADSSRGESSDLFRFGELVWTSGDNDGYSMEVKYFDFDTDTFLLFEQMPEDIQVGDTYTVYYGCDKSQSTCLTRFDNIENFRGEPYMPGPDRAYDVVHGREREVL